MISVLSGLTILAMAPTAEVPPPRAAAQSPAAPNQGSRARGDFSSIISEQDYPVTARRNGEEGVVGILLDIGPNGRVAACTVTSSSGHAILDETACRLMTERARLIPARDELGRPSSDRIWTRVVWQIAKVIDLEPTITIQVQSATPDGEVSCSAQVDDQPPVTRPCAPALADTLRARARAARRNVERAIVTKITPAGQVAWADPGDRGERGVLYATSEGDLIVNHNGFIRDCRLIRNEYVPSASLAPNALSGVPASLCEVYSPGSELLLPTAASGPRRKLRVEIRGYLRW